MIQKLKIAIIALIFLLGVFIMSYPVISSLVNNINNHSEFVAYNQTIDNMQSAETKALFEQAEKYNASLNDTVIISDPFDVEAYEKIGADYEETFNLDPNGLIGYVEVPKLNINLPIYHGTEEDVLSKGAGHLQNTSFPIGGVSTHAIISAHTGLPGNTFFDYLTDVETGDEFYLYVLDRVLKYQVDQVKVVLPENTDDLRIIPNEDHITLLTCTPYGVNSHRLLVRGVRVEYVEEKNEFTNISTSIVSWGDYEMFFLGYKIPYWVMIIIIVTFIAIVIIVVKVVVNKGKKIKENLRIKEEIENTSVLQGKEEDSDG